MLSALANPLRFKSRKQVIRLAGLDISASRSGKKTHESVPVISKKGDAELRYGLVQAALIAWTMLKNNESFNIECPFYSFTGLPTI